MAFNPFLSMGEPIAPVATDALNPFMIAESEPAEFAGDNPFATSNPFSDFGDGFNPPDGDTVPVDIFGTGGQCEPQATFDGFATSPVQLNVFASAITEPVEKIVKPSELELISTTTDDMNMSEEELYLPKRPPLPSRPLPPETKNLIDSVTGHMEFTSSHLLDRIPPTRTPSPVSARDIHSPSPTPEPEIEELPTEPLDINRNKPARPIPPRPPPARPTPPRPTVPPPPVQTQPQKQTDDINLFDAPVPVPVKPTKEDILSLYTAPKKEQKPVDFLSDDFVDNMTSDTRSEMLMTTTGPSPMFGVHENITTSASEAVPTSTTTVFSESVTTEASLNNLKETDHIESITVMDCSEPAAECISATVDSSPFANMGNETIANYKSEKGMKNPFEDVTSDFDVAATETSPFNIESRDTGAAENVFDSQNLFEDSATSKGFESQQNDAFQSSQGSPFGEMAAEPVAVVATNNKDPFVSSESATQWRKPPPAPIRSNIPAPKPAEPVTQTTAFPESDDAFDAFSAKFDSAGANHNASAAWGDDGFAAGAESGFEAEAFDPFLSMGAPPPPAATPRLDHQSSKDSGDDTFSVFIRPKDSEANGETQTVRPLAPPPRPQALPESPRFNPFDKSGMDAPPQQQEFSYEESRRMGGGDDDGNGGGETPPTPLFDDDVSQPLEDFPRTKYVGPGWEMHLRQPNKKKITGQRFWKKIFVRLAYQGDNPVVQLLKTPQDKEPFQELPLQACYSVSDIGAQQFDQFGKIFTVKLQYVFYKERPGVRPGQVTKAERITNKLSQFAAYAIQGDYQGVKEFGSDLRKLGLPVEHAPQMSQLFKIGSLSYEDVKQFSCCVEEALFRLPAHRDRALTYKLEEVQITAVDELYVEQDADGAVQKQIARVRLFFLGFLSGMPDVELGVNDLRRQGKEVVGRHDIIPVVTEEWIRVEDTEFHTCVQPEEFTNTKIIKFKPPDACYIELMRFRVRPPKNRELPLQLKAVWCVTGTKVPRVELRADILVPGFASRKLGQIPCEDVCVRFPIPECWIYLFRVEKHFRYGSVKSAHRRTGKIKGIERFLGAVDTLQESLIEVTSGQAKYEHQHRAIVWRMPRLPKEGQGAYTTHNLVCRMALTSFDQIPAELAPHAFVEFTMPATQVSHTTVRSVSLQNHDSDDPPEKYVRYLARHEYIVGIERTSGQDAPAYAVAAKVDPPAAIPSPQPAVPQPPSSDSDSD